MSNPYKPDDQVEVISGMSKKIVGLRGRVMYVDGEFCEVELEGRKDYDRVHYSALSYQVTGDKSPYFSFGEYYTTTDDINPKVYKPDQVNVSDQVLPTDAKAKRYNNNKPKLSYNLLSREVNELEASVWSKGAEKYEAGNWLKGQSLVDAIDSLQRHTAALLNGEDNDKETGLPHVGHIITCAKIMALAYLKGGELDDRVK